jgi:hypothetical protein
MVADRLLLLLAAAVLQVAFDLLEDMRASGLTPSTPTCSALIYACLQNNNFAAARKVGAEAVSMSSRWLADVQQQAYSSRLIAPPPACKGIRRLVWGCDCVCADGVR